MEGKEKKKKKKKKRSDLFGELWEVNWLNEMHHLAR